jgi:uncharacterized phage-associated protein
MATPKIDSIELAKFILAKLGAMPHLKLQKLVYYIEAWHLAIFEESIIRDDFEAWMHGPVCKRVWKAFRDATAPVYGMVALEPKDVRLAIKTAESSLSKDQIELIGDVLIEYGDKTSYYLECLTHSELPWREARRGVPPDAGSVETISKKTMKEFYQKALYGKSAKA